jgi:hypothetical protein
MPSKQGLANKGTTEVSPTPPVGSRRRARGCDRLTEEGQTAAGRPTRQSGLR